MSAGRSVDAFVTATVGNTLTAVPKSFGAKEVDQDAEWAQFEAGLEDTAPAGPARSIEFSATSDSYAFNGPSGAKVGVMEIVGSRGNAVVMKNRVTRITLGNVTVRAFPTFEHPAQTMNTHWAIQSLPTIDGAQPHEWRYTVDMLLDASGGTLSIRKNSVALRAPKCSLLSCLDDTEELVLVSSIHPATIRISKDKPYASGCIEARLFLRSIPRVAGLSPINSCFPPAGDRLLPACRRPVKPLRRHGLRVLQKRFPDGLTPVVAISDDIYRRSNTMKHNQKRSNMKNPVFSVALLLIGVVSAGIAPLQAACPGGVSTYFKVSGDVTNRAA